MVPAVGMLRPMPRLVGPALCLGLLLAACSRGNGPSPSTDFNLTPPASTIAAPSPPPSVTLLVDTDVAPDDLVALSFLLSAPNVEVVAITVSGTGEAHCDGGVATVLGLLEQLDAPPIAVACGRETPLTGDKAFPDAWRTHADSGSGLDLPATDRAAEGTAVELIGTSTAAHEGLTILNLGPLTNLADAIQGDATLADRIGVVFVMGGAVTVPGNAPAQDGGAPVEGAVAEWNIYVDPHAAQVVIDAGLEPRFVSLDGTNQVPVTTAYAARLTDEPSTAAAMVVADLFAANPFMGSGGYYLWDPLAAELVAGYPVGTFTDARIEVEEANLGEWGMTQAIDGAATAAYLSVADRSAAEDTLLAVLNSP